MMVNQYEKKKNKPSNYYGFFPINQDERKTVSTKKIQQYNEFVLQNSVISHTQESFAQCLC